MNTKVSNTVDNALGKVMKKWVAVLKAVNPENETVRDKELTSTAPFETVRLTQDNRLVFQQYGQDPKSLDELNVHELRIAAALADNLADHLQLKDEPTAVDKAQSLLEDYNSYAYYISETDFVSVLRAVIAEAA